MWIRINMLDLALLIADSLSMGTEQENRSSDVLPDLSQALASLGRGSLVAKIERLEAENKRLRQELAQALTPVPGTQETR